MNDTRLNLNETSGSDRSRRPARGRRLVTAAGCALVAAALATGALGCSKAAQITVAPDGVSVDDGTNAITYVLPATASQAEAQDGAEQAQEAQQEEAATTAETGTITVSGSDSVVTTPDMAELSLGVRIQSEKASDAQTEAAETIAAVKEAIVALGVSEDDISTSSLYLNPRYDWSGSTETIVGYEMNVTLSIENLPVAQVGTVISAATAAGANSVGNASYYCSDYDALYQEALASALTMARGKAQAIAETEGGVLGDAVSVTEGYDSQQYRASAATGSSYDAVTTEAAAKDEESASFDVDPGTIEIEAEVTVQYSVTYANEA